MAAKSVRVDKIEQRLTSTEGATATLVRESAAVGARVVDLERKPDLTPRVTALERLTADYDDVKSSAAAVSALTQRVASAETATASLVRDCAPLGAKITEQERQLVEALALLLRTSENVTEQGRRISALELKLAQQPPVLGATDPVPEGTPAGTVIYRRAV